MKRLTPHFEIPAASLHTRQRSIESIANALTTLDGDTLQAGLQLGTVIELLAADDYAGAREALELAHDELRALQWT